MKPTSGNYRHESLQREQKSENDPRPWKEKLHIYFLNGAVAQRYRADTPKNFILPFFDTLEVVEAERLSDVAARAVYRYRVQKEYLNPAGTLHGGAVSAFFDALTSSVLMMVARAPEFWAFLGTTRSLSCSYLRPAQLGEVVLFDVASVHVGKRLCLVRGTLKRESDGATLVTFEQHKYNNTEADSKL